MPKALSNETHERVDTMIREGAGPTAIAKEAGVSIGTVYYRAAKLGTPRYELKSGRWVPTENAEQPEEADKVTDMQKRIEALIQEGASPDEIRKREIVAKATLQATCERLGVEWVGERWESVKRPEGPGENGNAEREGVGDDELEKTLQQAINDGIDTGLSPDVIAQQEHCSVNEVLALSLTRGLHWHLDKLQWMTLTPPWADARDADGAAPARAEAPQGAEAHDVRARTEKAVALKDLKDLLLALNHVAAGEPLDNFERNVVTEAIEECIERREQVLLA